MQIEYEVIELETRHAFRIARTGSPERRRSVWVRLRDGDGLEGWGEAAPLPYYGESAGTIRAALDALGRVLADATDHLALERIEAGLRAALAPNPAAHAAVSAALHDLAGKRLGLPVWRLFGLDPATAPTSSFTLGLEDPERMRAKARDARRYPILKVKVGTPADRAVLEAVREEAPNVRLRVDANTAWTLKQAIAHLPLLEDCDVELLEQPLHPDDLEGLLQLRRISRIPIIADESCRIAADIPRLAGRVDGVNIKLAKCGSLREAIRIVHLARAHRMSLMLGCMIETTLGIAAAIQLAPLVDYADLDGAALLARDHFTGPGLEPDGRLRFNFEPGLGVTRR